MTWHTNGTMPSEFDPTTDRVLRTLDAAGTTEAEISEDMRFLVDLMLTIGSTDDSIPMEETVAVMDCAYIGLLYHRHMPWIDSNTDEQRLPDEAKSADYIATLTRLSTALIQQLGIPKTVIAATASVACVRTLPHLRRLPGDSDGGSEEAILHRHWLALTSIGMLVHTFLPGTPTPPGKG